MLCAVTSKDEIIVADPFEENFKIFDSKGNFVKSLGGVSPAGDDDFSRFIINPYCFTTHEGKLYILDMVLQRIGVFNMNGELLYAFHILRIFANAIVVTIGGNIVVGNSMGKCLTYHEYGTLLGVEQPDTLQAPLPPRCLLTTHDESNTHLIPRSIIPSGHYRVFFYLSGRRVNSNLPELFQVEQILLKNKCLYWLSMGQLTYAQETSSFFEPSATIGTVSSGIYFHAPTSFAVTSTDEIVVCDQGRVQMFKFNDKTPELIRVLRWQPKTRGGAGSAGSAGGAGIPKDGSVHHPTQQKTQVEQFPPQISPPPILLTTGEKSGEKLSPADPARNPHIQVCLKFMSIIFINGERYQCCEVLYDRNQCTVFGEQNQILKVFDKISRVEFNTGQESVITKIIASGVDIEFTAQINKLHVTEECVVTVQGGVNQIDISSGLVSCNNVSIAKSFSGNITHSIIQSSLSSQATTYEYPFRVVGPVEYVKLSSCSAQCNTNLSLITGSDSILKIAGDVSTVETTSGTICANRVSIAKSRFGDIVLNGAEQADYSSGCAVIPGKNEKEKEN